MRAMVPVSLRAPGLITALGNRFGWFIVSLPVKSKAPTPRLLEVHRRMRTLKHSSRAKATLAVLAAMLGPPLQA